MFSKSPQLLLSFVSVPMVSVVFVVSGLVLSATSEPIPTQITPPINLFVICSNSTFPKLYFSCVYVMILVDALVMSSHVRLNSWFLPTNADMKLITKKTEKSASPALKKTSGLKMMRVFNDLSNVCNVNHSPMFRVRKLTQSHIFCVLYVINNVAIHMMKIQGRFNVRTCLYPESVT